MGLLDRLTKKKDELSPEGREICKRINNLPPQDDNAISAMRRELTSKLSDKTEAIETRRMYDVKKLAMEGVKNFEKYKIDVENLPLDRIKIVEVAEAFATRPFTVSDKLKQNNSEIAQEFVNGWVLHSATYVPYVKLDNGKLMECFHGQISNTVEDLLGDVWQFALPMEYWRRGLSKDVDYLETSETNQKIIQFTGDKFIDLVQALSVQQSNIGGMAYTSELKKSPTISRDQIAKLFDFTKELTKDYPIVLIYEHGDEMFKQQVQQKAQKSRDDERMYR